MMIGVHVSFPGTGMGVITGDDSGLFQAPAPTDNGPATAARVTKPHSETIHEQGPPYRPQANMRSRVQQDLGAGMADRRAQFENNGHTAASAGFPVLDGAGARRPGRR